MTQQTIVTYADYVRATGDDCAVEQTVLTDLDEAISLVQADLGGRLLISAVRSETCEIWAESDGLSYAYPLATPITAVDADAPYTIDFITSRLRGGFPSVWPDLTLNLQQGQTAYATVSYTGGFTHATLPSFLRRAICAVAYGLAHRPVSSLVPAGATSVAVGDVSVTYSGGARPAIEDIAPGLGAMLSGYKRRRIRG